MNYRRVCVASAVYARHIMAAMLPWDCGSLICSMAMANRTYAKMAAGLDCLRNAARVCCARTRRRESPIYPCSSLPAVMQESSKTT